MMEYCRERGRTFQTDFDLGAIMGELDYQAQLYYELTGSLMENPNDTQVGGTHYHSEENPQYQHWDYVIETNLDYFTATATKYVVRYSKKGGVQDLQKAKHYIQKLLFEKERRPNRVLKQQPDIMSAQLRGFYKELSSQQITILEMCASYRSMEDLKKVERLLNTMIQ